MAQNTLSIQLNDEEISKLKQVLSSEGWMTEDVNNEYIHVRFKNISNGMVCTVYTSKKVVIQGNGNPEDILNRVRVSDVNITPHVGVDEVGKGDYFGPLVVVACFVDSAFVEKYGHMGLGDSKRFTDIRIREMYAELKGYEYYYVSIVNPGEYNEVYSRVKNASILLAQNHAKVIEMALNDLRDKGVDCNQVVIDQFSSKKSRVVDELGPLGKEVEFIQFHKGESDIAVAAASVIARGIFLDEMDKLNSKYYFKFPKGASDVISQAKEFVRLHGVKELEKVAKTSFKTTGKVIQSSF